MSYATTETTAFYVYKLNDCTYNFADKAHFSDFHAQNFVSELFLYCAKDFVRMKENSDVYRFYEILSPFKKIAIGGYVSPRPDDKRELFYIFSTYKMSDLFEDDDLKRCFSSVDYLGKHKANICIEKIEE